MIPLDPKICREFLDEIMNFENEKLIDVLIQKYYEGGLDFHRIFLRSKITFDISLNILDKLYEGVEGLSNDVRTSIRTDFAFIIYLRNQQELYDKSIRDVLENSRCKIYVEDLLLHLEYVTELIERGKSFLGHPNIEKISFSQLGHLQDSFDTIIEYIIKYKIPFSYKVPSMVKKECDDLFLSASYIKSIKNCLEEHSYQMLIPYWTEKFWYLEQNPKYWGRMEKYRDLNSIYQDRYKTMDEQKNIMQETGALRIYGDNEIMWLDTSKECEYEVSMELHQRYKRIETVFGDPDVEFLYYGKRYKIRHLLCLFEALYVYALRKWKDEEAKNSEPFGIFGRKALIRAIDINGSIESKLLDLFAYDFDRDAERHYISHDKPLLKKGDLFYIIPSRISEIALDRMFDKILTNEVTVDFSGKKGSDLKGFVFENNLENFFRSNGFLFGKVPHSKNRGIPEIDGMFVIDDCVFIYEAKASIPPNSAVDAHNLLKDTLIKARDQIDIRMNLLLNDNNAKTYIEQVSGIQFKDRSIFPFILVNHRTFSGYKELKASSADFYFPIVCFDDLKSILVQGRVPVWNYNKEKDNYKRSLKLLMSGNDLWNFMMDQFANLKTMEESIVSVSDIGVGYKIVRPSSIYEPMSEYFSR